MSITTRLGDFPWDALTEYKATAGAHPAGLVDLSVGAPVDPVPDSIQRALNSAAHLSGYPATHGTAGLREAAAAALRRRFDVTVDPAAVLPTIGSKELIAWLPTLLGLGPGDTVVIPELAYPTYQVGARLAGARVLRSDGLLALGPEKPALIWLNTPSNPTGKVLGVEHLRKVVDWARERGVLVASDECYLGLGWGEPDAAEPRSVLHPSISGGDHTGLLAVHSLSKVSNLAGYRAGLITGDATLIARLLQLRRHAGMIVPHPIQAAMIAALADDTHVDEQRARYRSRRQRMRKSLWDNGFRIDHSEAGLYLWATRDEDAWQTVSWFADRGILVAPGNFYGPTGARHVRIALTATDERVAEFANRLDAGQ